MLDAIRRVISGEDIEETQGPEDLPPPPQVEHQVDATTTPPPPNGFFVDGPPPSSLGMTMESPAAAVIETTEDDNNNNNNNNAAMDVDVHHRDGDNSTAGSSLSDASADRREPSLQQQQQQQPMRMVVEEGPRPRPPPIPIPPIPHSSLARNDSRNSNDSYSSYGRQSSQNSSRDWGWFEDVHITSSDHLPTIGGGGGVMNAAAAAGGGGGAASGNLKRSKDHSNIGPSHDEESNNKKKGKKGGSGGGDDSNNNNNNNIRSVGGRDTTTRNRGGRSGGGGSPLVPNLGLLYADGEYGGGDGLFQYQPLEPLRHQATARDMESEAAVQAVTAPNYVLEESLSSQLLWKDTAGNRPPQPLEERAFFEKMWAQNFARSQVEYRMPVEVLTATTPISLSPFADGNFDTAAAVGTQLSNYNLAVIPPHSDGHPGGGGGGMNPSNVAEATLVSRLNDPSQAHRVASITGAGSGGQGNVQRHEIINRKVSGSDGQMTVLIKGDNVFGTTVSKSFVRPGMYGGGVDTVNISVASYRVVESSKHGKYAQFLVIYREGSIRDTIGVWKRYSDFQELSRKVTKAHEGCSAVIANMSPLAVTEEQDVEHLPNAITSWRLLKKRQRWYRCLDAGYLSLKVFLLERFLHDILFESSSPTLLRDFVGVPPPRA